jgi:hypothetical protein
MKVIKKGNISASPKPLLIPAFGVINFFLAPPHSSEDIMILDA